ncbi:MAG: deoxyribodipyrimidine photo-lyase [Candidatus Rhabdochlamydia sp.]
MQHHFKKSLFIFHRDLRLEDNTALLFALNHSETVIPCFIFTPEQVENNPYKSVKALQFMIESLEDLDEALHKNHSKLYLFYGKSHEIVARCIEELHIDAVFFNQDYTPYSQKRDAAIQAVCDDHHISCLSFEDLLLHPIQQTLKSDGSPYVVFTPFYHNASSFPVNLPDHTAFSHYYNKPISFAKTKAFYQSILPSRSTQQKGGRKEALNILTKLKKGVVTTPIYLNQPVTHLSPHLKFTTVSVREVYFALKHSQQDHSSLIRSLYWRDFFLSIAFHFPHVFTSSFHQEFNNLKWKDDLDLFQKWCEGKTGFPIVDAGMRELNATGLMNNRARMIAASFLVKDLHLSWQWGEKYFAQHLIDYDPSVNNGNWQWVASTGCDRQPYFRIFNPWLQQKKFDPDALYIKEWIPELQEVPLSHIHTWYTSYNSYFDSSYPMPCVDHKRESQIALHAYQTAALKN